SLLSCEPSAVSAAPHTRNSELGTRNCARSAYNPAMLQTDSRQRFRHTDLHDYIAGTLAHFDVPAADARLAADVLLYADLSGIESHGIAHLGWHPGYVPGLKQGGVKPRPDV